MFEFRSGFVALFILNYMQKLLCEKFFLQRGVDGKAVLAIDNQYIIEKFKRNHFSGDFFSISTSFASSPICHSVYYL